MQDPRSDLDLLRGMQARDESALAALYDRHAPLLYALVLRIVGRTADAEDVVQEAWMQAWRQAGSFDPKRGTVGAWLVTVARSRALDRWRSVSSRARAESAGEIDPPAPAADPAAGAAQSQLAAHLQSALAALGPEQREVLELAYFRGMSQSEIAAHLGAPLGTVKSWTRQGLGRMRETMPRETWT